MKAKKPMWDFYRHRAHGCNRPHTDKPPSVLRSASARLTVTNWLLSLSVPHLPTPHTSVSTPMHPPPSPPTPSDYTTSARPLSKWRSPCKATRPFLTVHGFLAPTSLRGQFWHLFTSPQPCWGHRPVLSVLGLNTSILQRCVRTIL